VSTQIPVTKGGTSDDHHHSSRNHTISRRSPVTLFIVRHPIAAFLIGAYVVGAPLLIIFTTASSLPPFVTTAVGLAFTYIALLGSALTVTWWIGGRGAVVRLTARFLQWRFGVTRWLHIVLALPALTIVFAALSGTLEIPAGGWSALAISSCYRRSFTAP
jgi:hypothetical protein